MQREQIRHREIKLMLLALIPLIRNHILLLLIRNAVTAFSVRKQCLHQASQTRWYMRATQIMKIRLEAVHQLVGGKFSEKVLCCQN